MPKIKITRWLSTIILTTVFTVSLVACQSTFTENTPKTKINVDISSPLTVERIYKDSEFSSDYISRLRWILDVKLEKTQED